MSNQQLYRQLIQSPVQDRAVVAKPVIELLEKVNPKLAQVLEIAVTGSYTGKQVYKPIATRRVLIKLLEPFYKDGVEGTKFLGSSVVGGNYRYGISYDGKSYSVGTSGDPTINPYNENEQWIKWDEVPEPVLQMIVMQQVIHYFYDIHPMKLFYKGLNVS